MEDSSLLLLVLVALLVALFLIKLTHRSNKKSVRKQTSATTTIAIPTVVLDPTSPQEEYVKAFQLCVDYHLSATQFQLLDQNGISTTVLDALKAREQYLRGRAFPTDDYQRKQLFMYLNELKTAYSKLSKSCLKALPPADRASANALFSKVLNGSDTKMSDFNELDTLMHAICVKLAIARPRATTAANFFEAHQSYQLALSLYTLAEATRKRRVKEHAEFIQFLEKRMAQIDALK